MQKNGKIRVLECIRQGQIGGGESHLLSLVENLDKNRFEPIVLSFTPGPMVDQLQKMGIETHVIHTTKPFNIFIWKKVKQFIRDKKVDLVHAHGTRANSNVLWASKSLGIPVIYTVHGWSFHPDQKGFVRTLRIKGEQYLVTRTALNISVSASNQQSGKDVIPAFESVVVNNGIDQQKFNPANQYKNIRHEFNIPENKLLLLFIARFTLHKQPLTLIKAFTKAVKENPALHLLMVGDGDQKEEAVQLIEQAGISQHVTLEKFRQDVPHILASADVFILPSLWEGLPIGLLEAMSMGKAIIASNVDGTREIIEHGVNGWLVQTDNLIDNTANAILELSKNDEMRLTFQQNAKSTVAKRFNAATMTRHIEDLYSDVLKKRSLN